MCPTRQARGSKEEFVKTIKSLCLAMLAFSLLAVPVFAQKGRDRSNKGGAAKADARVDKVQSTNKSDNDKHGKHKGETKGQHKAKGHSKH